VWIADSAWAKEVDRRSSEEYGVPAIVLMERAGLAVFGAVKELLPEGGKVSVVCGPGNNGGDGHVVARLCHESGYQVECISTASAGGMSPECNQQMLQAEAQGVRPILHGDPRWSRRLQCLLQSDLIVDAVLGIGAKGEVRGPAREAIEAMNRSGVPVLSVDVPSGIDADTGQELGESVWAVSTVTFGMPKPFLFQGTGLEHAGHWTVADIGIPSDLLATPTTAKLICPMRTLGSIPERLQSSHKGSNGHVLVVAGSDAMRGAAVLCAKAAFRSGAGMVTVASIAPVLDAVMSQVPEACLLPLEATEGAISRSSAERIVADQHRYSAAVFGPGLTHGEAVRETLASIWSRWETPSCIDADALNALACGVPLPPCACILTPHPGEMSRIVGTSVDEIQSDRFAAVTDAVRQTGMTVLLKGAYSILGSPHEPLSVNTTGNPGMASAGMGDVLSGVTAALLGQGLAPVDAGLCAMYWHGYAGDICAERLAPIGFTASDVADALPLARAKLTSCAGSSPRSFS